MRRSTESEMFVEHTLKILGNHTQVQRQLGAPLRCVSPFRGNFTQMAVDGDFRCTGPGKGGREGEDGPARATVKVVATSDPTKMEADWVYQRLDVEVKRRDRVVRISLTERLTDELGENTYTYRD